MNGTTVWILLLASNPACVFLGYLWGRVTRATVEIAEVAVEGEESKVKGRPILVEGRGSGVTALRVMAVALVLIGIATALMGFMFTRNQDRITGCVAGYSNALADTLVERSVPQQEAQEALDLVMETLVDSLQAQTPENSKRIADAIRNYVSVRKDTKEALAQNPLPDAPRDACSRLVE